MTVTARPAPGKQRIVVFRDAGAPLTAGEGCQAGVGRRGRLPQRARRLRELGGRVRQGRRRHRRRLGDDAARLHRVRRRRHRVPTCSRAAGRGSTRCSATSSAARSGDDRVDRRRADDFLQGGPGDDSLDGARRQRRGHLPRRAQPRAGRSGRPLGRERGRRAGHAALDRATRGRRRRGHPPRHQRTQRDPGARWRRPDRGTRRQRPAQGRRGAALQGPARPRPAARRQRRRHPARRRRCRPPLRRRRAAIAWSAAAGWTCSTPAPTPIGCARPTAGRRRSVRARGSTACWRTRADRPAGCEAIRLR